MSLSKWPPGDHIEFFCFRTLTLVWLWISTPNFSGTILMYMGRNLLLFSDVILKMAAWQPYCFFFRFLDSVGGMVSGVLVKFALEFQFQISYAYWWWSWARAYWFSATSLSKWLPGSHFAFFGFQTLTFVWLWTSTPNFNGTILMYMDRSLLIFSDINVKMAAWRPYWMFWFPDSNFSLALNMNSKLQWPNTCVYE